MWEIKFVKKLIELTETKKLVWYHWDSEDRIGCLIYSKAGCCAITLRKKGQTYELKIVGEEHSLTMYGDESYRPDFFDLWRTIVGVGCDRKKTASCWSQYYSILTAVGIADNEQEGCEEAADKQEWEVELECSKKISLGLENGLDLLELTKSDRQFLFNVLDQFEDYVLKTEGTTESA